MADTAVVGAGVVGLAVAHRLSERGENVTVFEAAPDVGGLAGGWVHDDVSWDRVHQVVHTADSQTRRLLRLLGLEDSLRWSRTSTAILSSHHGAQRISTFLDLARFRGLGAVDKARLTVAALTAARFARLEERPDQAALAWLVETSGAAACRRIWTPYMRAHLGEDWADLPAVTALNVVRDLRSARRPARHSRQTGYLVGGHHRLVQRYAEWLTDHGVKFNMGAAVRLVRPLSSGLSVQLDHTAATFDRVVLTTAAPEAAALCPSLTPRERERLRSVPSVALVCGSALLPYSVARHFVTYVEDVGAPVSAIVQMTALTGRSQSRGRHVVYLAWYGPALDTRFAASDSVLQAEMLDWLHRLTPGFRPGDVEAFKLARAHHAFVPGLVRSRAVVTTTSVPGLQLLGSTDLGAAPYSVNEALALVQNLR
jgi:protoporphyrinogen oxidase